MTPYKYNESRVNQTYCVCMAMTDQNSGDGSLGELQHRHAGNVICKLAYRLPLNIIHS